MTRDAEATTLSVRGPDAAATKDLLLGIRNATYRLLVLLPLLSPPLSLLPLPPEQPSSEHTQSNSMFSPSTGPS